MITAFYVSSFLVSLVLSIAYMFIYHKHFDIHITLVFVLVPVVNLGYAMLASAQTLEEAVIANRLTYIGACYAMLFLTFAVFSLCDIRLNLWIRAGMMLLSSAVFLSTMTITHSGLFYRSIAFERVGDAVLLYKEYGVMHAVFRVMIYGYFLMEIAAMVYSYFRKNQVSRKTIYLMFLPVAVAMLSFFGGRMLFDRVELIPAAYVAAQIVYLIIVSRMCLYNITETAIDSLVETGATGFASFDFSLNYLGSNGTARRVFPALNELTVDRPIDRNEWMRANALKWLEAFRSDEANCDFHYETEGKTYLINVNYLFDGHRKRGYQFFVTDDTKDQQYIRLINSYNTQLQAEVEEKTAHIVEMHDKLILGMATMVESRDNSTGGHIRRTSEGVRLLIDEMRRDASNGFTDEFCRDIVKAAPMHDLGKIAVDDAILRKPGRFTPEEFEKMKAHAAEGARIVREILKGTDDDYFRHIAQNVAHYHHERWDGSGYPEGLKGEQIPIEARIMAIADVYDALVSKRVYKDSMSFEQADGIIMEGMGKHFDKRLEPYYVAARPKLEAYYASLTQETAL